MISKFRICVLSTVSKFVSHMMWRLHPIHFSTIRPWSRAIILPNFLLCLLPTKSIWLKLLFIFLTILCWFLCWHLTLLFFLVLKSWFRYIKTGSLVIKNLFSLIKILYFLMNSFMILPLKINTCCRAERPFMPLNFRHISWIRQSNWFLLILLKKIWTKICLFSKLTKSISIWHESSWCCSIFY